MTSLRTLADDIVQRHRPPQGARATAALFAGLGLFPELFHAARRYVEHIPEDVAKDAPAHASQPQALPAVEIPARAPKPSNPRVIEALAAAEARRVRRAAKRAAATANSASHPSQISAK